MGAGADLARRTVSAHASIVPREPVWRVLNVARGRYVRWLGNPPGHIQHFSRAAFLALAGW